jgi:hypothetical protein
VFEYAFVDVGLGSLDLREQLCQQKLVELETSDRLTKGRAILGVL